MIVYKPKADFEASINIQGQYIELLKQYHAQLMIKKDKGNEYVKSKMRVELYELSQKLDMQIELFQEKHDSFHNHFLPHYNEQLKECNAHFDKTYKKAKGNIKSYSEDIQEKINQTIKNYEELDDENQAHIEVKNVIYKDLKILLSL